MSRDEIIEGYILSIVQNHNISEQIELQNMLQEKGYNLSQATLSRKLKKLNIVKVGSIYKIIDFKTPHHPIILNLQISDSGIIILHTHPGNASNLAYFIDQKYVTYNFKNSNEAKILGTIAGDDTVMMILRSKADAAQVLIDLKEDFPYLSIRNT